LLPSSRAMTKIAGSGSESGSGSISQKHGSPRIRIRIHPKMSWIRNTAFQPGLWFRSEFLLRCSNSERAEFDVKIELVKFEKIVHLFSKKACIKIPDLNPQPFFSVKHYEQIAITFLLPSLFGSKQMGALRQIEQAELSADELAEAGWRGGQAAPPVRLTGWLSSCVHGEGRAAADRQFYYINSRPCDPARISKVVNEASTI
jgi:hypothetical protein